MATKTLTISIPIELENFLKNNPALSPSKLLQTKLFELMSVIPRCENCEKLESFRTKMEKALSFIEDKGFIKEFWGND